MKVIRNIFSILFISLLVIAVFIVVNHSDPPKEWWGDEMTISQIESEHEKQIELQIASYREKGFIRYNSKTDSFRGATKEEIDEAIKQLQAEREMKSSQWLQLKSLYTGGDKILSYSAPPLTGTFGYILVRNNKVIFKYEMGIQ